MSMDMEQIFCEIDRLIETPETWIRGEEARDEHGLNIDPTSPDAYQFCLVGAVRAITAFHEDHENLHRNMLFYPAVDAIASEIERVQPERHEDREISKTYILTCFNDDAKTEHKDVRNVVDNCRLSAATE